MNTIRIVMGAYLSFKTCTGTFTILQVIHRLGLHWTGVGVWLFSTALWALGMAAGFTIVTINQARYRQMIESIQ